VQAEIYFSAMDTMLSQRFPSDSAWYVADTIYWQPLLFTAPHVSLEDAPAALEQIGRERHRNITLVELQKAIARNGVRVVHGPLVIFGPIDMLGEDDALFRVNLYLGLNGQELTRVRSRLVDGRWRVVEISLESST
jgi:hypothetical protein